LIGSPFEFGRNRKTQKGRRKEIEQSGGGEKKKKVQRYSRKTPPSSNRKEKKIHSGLRKGQQFREKRGRPRRGKGNVDVWDDVLKRLSEEKSFGDGKDVMLYDKWGRGPFCGKKKTDVKYYFSTTLIRVRGRERSERNKLDKGGGEGGTTTVEKREKKRIPSSEVFSFTDRGGRQIPGREKFSEKGPFIFLRQKRGKGGGSQKTPEEEGKGVCSFFRGRGEIFPASKEKGGEKGEFATGKSPVWKTSRKTSFHLSSRRKRGDSAKKKADGPEVRGGGEREHLFNCGSNMFLTAEEKKHRSKTSKNFKGLGTQRRKEEVPEW